jgi:hypothetical protein
MGELHGIAVDDATTRAELVDALATRLAEPDYLTERLARLEPRELRALTAAYRSGGEIRGFLLQRLLESDDPDAARSLMDDGFLFRTFAPLGRHRGEVFAVPDELLAHPSLAAADEPPTEPPPPTAAPARAERRASDPAFSVFAIASYAARHPEAAARTGGFRAEVDAWAHEPGGWAWTERWAFLEHLCDRAGLLSRGQVASSRLERLLDERHELAASLWHAYLRDRTWLELVRAEVPFGEQLAEQADPPTLRATVLHEVARLATGSWVSLIHVCEWLQRAAPTLLREQLDARSAGYINPETGQPLFADGSWDHIEARLIRYIVLGPLYWLGIVATDVAGERVALTAGGEALLGGDAAASGEPQRSEACSWDADGRLHAPASTRLGKLLRAERYVQLEARGQVSEYTLARDRLSAALTEAGSVDESRRLLVELSGGQALPDTIAAVLADCEQRFGAFVLRPAVLLEARTSTALDEVDPAALRGRLAPTTAEVPAARALELADELRARGHLPRVDAALRLMAGRRAYQALVDEQVLEFLLVCLLALERVGPYALAQLEGAPRLRDRLLTVFPAARSAELRARAERLAVDLGAPPSRRRRR